MARMKKAWLFCLFFSLLVAAPLAAADYAEAPFVPLSPEVIGRGDSFVADAHGYDSLFFNPAGFSRENGSFTLVSGSSWIYSRPDALLTLGEGLITGSNTPASLLGYMNSQVTTGGFGAGASAGIGYVGNGLGLGVVFIADSLLSGPTLLGMTGDLTGTLGFIGGLSFPLEVFGAKIHLGGDVRPMIRVRAPLTSGVALGVLDSLATGGDAISALNAAGALYGVGIGLDFGSILEMGWFTVGLSVRDLGGTQFRYAQSTFGATMSSLAASLKFPTGTPTTADTYTIPMDIRFGVSLHPDFGTFSSILDPSVSVDVDNIAGFLSGTSSIWTLLHAGAQVRVLSLVSVSAGLNQGYLTAGVGLKLLFLDINAAVFTRELGAYIGDMPNSGATLDVAVRW